MRTVFKASILFDNLLALKEHVVINGKQLPDYIFVKNELHLFAFGTGEIVGDREGYFHNRLCEILKTHSENRYYIFPLSREMYHYSEKLPIFEFSKSDHADTYKTALSMNFINKSKGPDFSFFRVPENLLFVSKELTWFIVDDDFLGWSIFGCYDETILRTAEKELESFILDKKAIASEIGIAYTLDGQALFRRNYWDLLIR